MSLWDCTCNGRIIQCVLVQGRFDEKVHSLNQCWINAGARTHALVQCSFVVLRSRVLRTFASVGDRYLLSATMHSRIYLRTYIYVHIYIHTYGYNDTRMRPILRDYASSWIHRRYNCRRMIDKSIPLHWYSRSILFTVQQVVGRYTLPLSATRETEFPYLAKVSLKGEIDCGYDSEGKYAIVFFDW